MLFIPLGKRSNSRSEMFYKIYPLKNLAILTGKHMCWRFFLINFIKKRLRPRCFPVNFAKCLSTVFYIVFLNHCFVFFRNSIGRIGSPLLFRIYLVFIPKFLLSVIFARITKTAPSLF